MLSKSRFWLSLGPRPPACLGHLGELRGGCGQSQRGLERKVCIESKSECVSCMDYSLPDGLCFKNQVSVCPAEARGENVASGSETGPCARARGKLPALSEVLAN